MLANRPLPREPKILEEFHRSAEQEPARRRPAKRHLGDGLDQPAAGRADLRQRSLESRPRDPLAAMPLVDVEAGDPPVGQRRRILVVLAAVLDTGQLRRTAVLAPALGQSLLVEHECGVRPIGADALLLDRAATAAHPIPLGVEPDAPTAAEHTVVALDQLSKGIPGRRVQGAYLVR